MGVKFPDIRVAARDELTTYYINDTVRQYMEAAESRVREFKLFGLVSGLDSDGAGTASDRLAAIKDRQLQGLIAETIRDVIPFQHWKESREIYEVHPAMTESLMKMGSSVKIPGEIFRRLRHPNPFFTLTDGADFLHADGKPGRVLGFYVCGAVANHYPKSEGTELSFKLLDGKPGTAFKRSDQRSSIVRSTHDSNVNALHVMVVSEVLSPDKKMVVDFDVCHLTIPLTLSFTLDELVNEIVIGGFRWTEAMKGPQIHVSAMGIYLKTMARVTVAHLLYACSRTSEIDEGKNDRPPGRKKAGVKPRKPAKVHRVGYRIGSRIEDATRKIRDQRAAGISTGATLPPHMRAAHAHLYRVGPGRKEIEIKFLDPIPVNMKNDDGVTATVHPMTGGAA